MRRYVFAMTGASGCRFGLRVLAELARHDEVHLIMTSMAIEILREETGVDWACGSESETQKAVRSYFPTSKISFWSEGNLAAPVASGSFGTDGMLVVPCSMKTLSGIANGYAGTLVERAADVTVKEGRRLLLSPREMPFSSLHLENMLKLSRVGVKIAPPVPAFYHKPQTIDDIVDFIAGKILDSFGHANALYSRWGGHPSYE